MRKLITIVLLGGLICLLGVAPLLAQEVWSTLSEYEKATGEMIWKFSEAPMLRAKVDAEELPPVGKRLPEEPLVVEPIEEIGQYGGTLNVFAPWDIGYDDGSAIWGYGNALRISPDLKGVVPSIARDWEFSEDGKSFILYLRKGMRWSDGAPFTVDDIFFWWEDVILNKELTPAIPMSFTPGGEPWEIEVIDDYTVRFSFAAPQPFLILQNFTGFAGGEGYKWLPKHYLKKYHPKYTSAEKIEEICEEEGFKNWVELFNKKRALIGYGSYWVDTETPTLRAWLLKEKGIDWWLLERNPYYFAIDTAGNQLPYIDRIFITNVGNTEIYNAKIISGEADFASWSVSFDNYTLYVESAEEGDYRVLNWNTGLGSDVMYQPNQNLTGDDVLAEILRDVRFRRALSVAIDRDDINEALYFGLAVPRQWTVIPDSKYYEEEFARAYAQYDTEMANALLDEMGLDKRDAEDYRLRPDGKRLSLLIEYAESAGPRVSVTELVKEYWEAIGIDVAVKVGSAQLVSQRTLAREVEISIQQGAVSTDITFPSDLGWRAPWHSNLAWGVLWGKWYETGGKEGEEPPEVHKKNLERWEKILVTMDEEERIRLTKEILRSNAENVWNIGTVGLPPQPVMVKNNLRNVPETGLWAWDDLYLVPYRAETFFFKAK
ncbi:ABC transporter substrate-binding protein [Candidatus Aerophobetes bacterium]|uniref:ABC transporter substrate-binding protein n=1 Tax=Aerophobetes bacterium TaxID=2030807 RepID=A0A523RST4_UNCAE|nr:MAG: ABC transporter substrate-binding protein [Candidatus Aerophobetes bacterium]